MSMAPQTEPSQPVAGISPERVGVLLVNLGTPDTADARGLRVYLKEFLSDPRVIENQGLVWKLALNGIILRTRPRRKARDYRKIWNLEKNELPLKTITRAQAEKLAADIAGDRVVVDWAMRYGNPSIASRIDALIAQGCDRLLVMPLYPQYSAATSATVCDEVFRVLGENACAADVAGDAALLRRSCLYRSARGFDRDASEGALVSTRSHRGVISRHAEKICREGRSL